MSYQSVFHPNLFKGQVFIVTGGGSGIATIQDLARATLQLPSKTAVIEPIKNSKIRDASWAVAYGLCMWGAGDTEESNGISTMHHAKHSILTWLSQFLP